VGITKYFISLLFMHIDRFGLIGKLYSFISILSHLYVQWAISHLPLRSPEIIMNPDKLLLRRKCKTIKKDSIGKNMNKEKERRRKRKKEKSFRTG